MTTVTNEKLLPARLTDGYIKSAQLSYDEPGCEYSYRIVWNTLDDKYSFVTHIPIKSYDYWKLHLGRVLLCEIADALDIDLVSLTFDNLDQLCGRKIAAKLGVEERYIPESCTSYNINYITDFAKISTERRKKNRKKNTRDHQLSVVSQYLLINGQSIPPQL